MMNALEIEKKRMAVLLSLKLKMAKRSSVSSDLKPSEKRDTPKQPPIEQLRSTQHETLEVDKNKSNNSVESSNYEEENSDDFYGLPFTLVSMPDNKKESTPNDTSINKIDISSIASTKPKKESSKPKKESSNLKKESSKPKKELTKLKKELTKPKNEFPATSDVYSSFAKNKEQEPKNPEVSKDTESSSSVLNSIQGDTESNIENDIEEEEEEEEDNDDDGTEEYENENDHPVYEAVHNLRRLGYTFTDIVKKIDVNPYFLLMVYTKLELPCPNPQSLLELANGTKTNTNFNTNTKTKNTTKTNTSTNINNISSSSPEKDTPTITTEKKITPTLTPIPAPVPALSKPPIASRPVSFSQKLFDANNNGSNSPITRTASPKFGSDRWSSHMEITLSDDSESDEDDQDAGNTPHPDTSVDRSRNFTPSSSNSGPNSSLLISNQLISDQSLKLKSKEEEIRKISAKIAELQQAKTKMKKAAENIKESNTILEDKSLNITSASVPVSTPTPTPITAPLPTNVPKRITVDKQSLSKSPSLNSDTDTDTIMKDTIPTEISPQQENLNIQEQTDQYSNFLTIPFIELKKEVTKITNVIDNLKSQKDVINKSLSNSEYLLDYNENKIKEKEKFIIDLKSRISIAEQIIGNLELLNKDSNLKINTLKKKLISQDDEIKNNQSLLDNLKRALNERIDEESDDEEEEDIELLRFGFKKAPRVRFKLYLSVLRCFRSFRFSPQFKEVASESYRSVTYSNKINPNKVFCPFESSGGTCNDSSCKYQHARDYTMSDTAILVELAKSTVGSNPDEQSRYKDNLTKELNSLTPVDNKFQELGDHIVSYRRKCLKELEGKDDYLAGSYLDWNRFDHLKRKRQEISELKSLKKRAKKNKKKEEMQIQPGVEDDVILINDENEDVSEKGDSDAEREKEVLDQESI